jgi:hypothetical protein
MFFRLHGWNMLGVLLEPHSWVARLSDRAWPAVALAPVAASFQMSLKRTGRRHGGIVAEMRHAACSVEMNKRYARKTVKVFFKPRVLRGVMSVPDVHFDHRRRALRSCDVAVSMIGTQY